MWQWQGNSDSDFYVKVAVTVVDVIDVIVVMKDANDTKKDVKVTTICVKVSATKWKQPK